MFKNWPALLALVSVLGMMVGAGAAEKQYGPGVTDTEIKIGNIIISDPRQVSDRPAVVRRSRVQGVAGVDEEIQSVRRYLG